jgi:hypothetical protein
MSQKRESTINSANTKRRLVFSLRHRESDALQVSKSPTRFPLAAPPLHAVAGDSNAVPNGEGEIENDHRKIMSPTTMLFDFRRTSCSNLADPIDSNVAAGPSSIRIKPTFVVAEQATSRSHPCRAPKSLTRFPLAAPPSHAVACDSHAVPNGGGEIENNHRKIMSPTTMLFDFRRTSCSNLAGPIDSNVAAGPSSIGIKHTFVVTEQATSRSHPCRAPKSLATRSQTVEAR